MTRNWAAFHRTQQDRARRAMAEGEHRPLPPVDQTDDQAPDQDEDPDRD